MQATQPPVIEATVTTDRPKNGSFVTRISSTMSMFLNPRVQAIGLALVLGFSAAVLAISLLSNPTPAPVTVQHSKCEDKGWFGNLLWRADSSKIIQVRHEPTSGSLFGPTSFRTTVTAERASGEVTQYDSNQGTWRVTSPAK